MHFGFRFEKEKRDGLLCSLLKTSCVQERAKKPLLKVKEAITLDLEYFISYMQTRDILYRVTTLSWVLWQCYYTYLSVHYNYLWVNNQRSVSYLNLALQNLNSKAIKNKRIGKINFLSIKLCHYLGKLLVSLRNSFMNSSETDYFKVFAWKSY